MQWSVIQFPGSNCDADAVHAVQHVLAQCAALVWHTEQRLPSDTRAVIVPGGFSYGDYLRSGAIAAHAPIMAAVKQFADNGGLVIGVCNGFQVLTETGLLPGSLMRNRELRFECRTVYLRVDNADTPFTTQYRAGAVVRMPIAHMDGCYFADETTLAALESNQQIIFRYCNAQGDATAQSNPNGSLRHIAGICNARRNVLGMMPHPERFVESALGGADGLMLFQSMVDALHG